MAAILDPLVTFSSSSERRSRCRCRRLRRVEQSLSHRDGALARNPVSLINRQRMRRGLEFDPRPHWVLAYMHTSLEELCVLIAWKRTAQPAEEGLARGTRRIAE